ncbi:MAG: DUF1761 domain-containing protein [Bacteroidetes bacterium]|nr:MAG: DUF1761 domain-containing protein [Bacteroidota bacterium]
MDMSQAFASLNWWAIIVASLSNFIIGGVWYSPIMFGRQWMEVNRFTDEDLKKGNQGTIFGGGYILAFISAFNLAMFLGPQSDVSFGIAAGALAGIGWVSTSMGIIYLFERKSGRHFFINAGCQVVTFIVMGAILGAWK